jgi:hypothetical protein
VKYCCSFRDSDGEIYEIVVTLSDAEVGDCMRQFREGQGPGAGPLARKYAWDRVPLQRGFEPLYAETRLVH